MASAHLSTSEGPPAYYAAEGAVPETGEVEGSTVTPGAERGLLIPWKVQWEGIVQEMSVSLLMDESNKDQVRWEVASEASASCFAATIDHTGLLSANMDARLDVEELVQQMISLCKDHQIQLIDEAEGGAGLILKLSHPIFGSAKKMEYVFRLTKQRWTEKDQRLCELRREIVRLKSIISKQKATIDRLSHGSVREEKTEPSAPVLTEEVTPLDRVPGAMGQFVEGIEEYVRLVGQKEKVTDQRVMDGLCAARMKEWQKQPERDAYGKPMFIQKMREYTVRKDPWDALHAQFLYVHRKDVRPFDTDRNDLNAIHWCAEYPSLSPMLQWLLKEGSIDPSLANPKGNTALHIAAEHNNIEGAKLLLIDGRVDKNARNAYGDTPLINAAWKKHTAMVSLLLQHGCDKSIKNKKGKTALFWAKKSKSAEMQELLKGPSRGFSLGVSR